MDFDSLPPQAAPTPEAAQAQIGAQAAAPATPLMFDDLPPAGQPLMFDDLPVAGTEASLDAEEKYNTPTEMAKAIGHGALKGLITSPGAALVETKLLGRTPEEIRASEEASPILTGVGEAAGLVGGAFIPGPTQAKILTKAGEAAAAAVGLGKIAEKAPLATRIGESVVRNAAEMAVYQGSDEVAKTILKDPKAAGESAIVNIGLAAALGGAGGAVWTGAVSPLWKATAGPKVEELLSGLRKVINKEEVLLPAAIKESTNKLNIRLEPEGLVNQAFNAEARAAADAYRAMKGLEPAPVRGLVDVDPVRAKRIADAYEQMKHEPEKPEVKQAYDALIKETTEQFQLLKARGLKLSKIAPDMENPYKNSTDLIKDVTENNHMWYYPTEQGFGAAGTAVKDNLPKNFSMISAQVGTKANPKAQQALGADLEKLGFKISEARGNYGGTIEPSFVVEHSGTPEEIAALNELAKKYKQDSVLHSSQSAAGRRNELHFSDDSKQVGYGAEINTSAKENYTDSDYGKFALKFDEPPKGYDHPLLRPSGEIINGEEVPANDIFRIVHDYFGHIKEGTSFGPKGEENAWRQHMSMFSPEAQKALTTETRGQNSWVNFGPYGEANRANPAMTKYADQKAGLLPDWAMDQTVAQALEISPVMRAALSTEHGKKIAQELYRAQNEAMSQELASIRNAVQERVDQSLGVPLEDIVEFSTERSGAELLAKVKNDLVKEFEGPIKQIKARDEANAKVLIPDENKIDAASGLVEKAVMDREVGTDSRYFNEWQHYAQRLLAKDDIGGVDALLTELFQRAKSSDDGALRYQLGKIRSYLVDYKESEIMKAGNLLGKEIGDVAAGRTAAADIISVNAEANRNYKAMVEKIEDVMQSLGLGDWRGPGTLLSKLDNLTAEQLIKKFSTKGDVALQKTLIEKYPEWAELVRQYEMKKFIAPSIKEHMGEKYLDYASLSKRLDKLRSGQPEYADFIMSPEAVETIKAAKTIKDAVGEITGIKDSGTPGGLGKVFKHVGAGAAGTIGYLMGHNPISSILIGEMAQRLTKDTPEAIKMGYLKYLGSEKEISAEGFKAMVDMVQSTYKGAAVVGKATENLFKREAQIIPIRYMPKPQDLEKLDKMVADSDQQPNIANRLINAPTAHYMQEQHDAVAATATGIVQYLKTLRPGDTKLAPLDKDVPPNPLQEARYNRALTIAQQPAIVLEHIKNGTLLPSDVQDLNAMYPSLYADMQKQIMAKIADSAHNEEPLPYATRISMSMFLATPLDSTMNPESIQAAQPKPAQGAPQQGPAQQSQSKGRPSAMKGKTASLHQTASQQAERDRGSRD